MSELVIPDIPYARALDFAARLQAGHLTAAESLAVAIIRGGENGEDAIKAAIDAAQEEYAFGSYRVPIRVIGDWSRLLVVLSTDYKLPMATKQKLCEEMRAMLNKKSPVNGVIVLDSGLRASFYELPAPDPNAPIIQIEDSKGANDGTASETD